MAVLDKGERVTIRTTGNTTVVVAGNNSVSNVAQSGETVIGAALTQIYFTTDAVITIARGSNTIMTLPANEADHWNFRESGMSLNEYPSANLVITTAAACNCTLVIELTKQS